MRQKKRRWEEESSTSSVDAIVPMGECTVKVSALTCMRNVAKLWFLWELYV